ncbi:uncharacterized protein SPAPADRAFT_55761 [Spathaspora passalidarum NRRL Y-27907]|uniref:CoA-binding domain-containing protein n=1 Tax=Spathaspora passalidarum (strain NRRL Y-27907 / 11-Y1) TaxID=619300 RepID=G3APU4_SPAPN|nr:uncharacterized protein SPAPADRAFT_55761 [Spathaspora passalidarum NRRL Y-27907]EGW32265.1 hypothetical protein SPAPADRAFT_55761 [Spathaspora passalidarum NRRL Y-27907]
MSMKLKIKSFFGSNRQYAVVGASNNPSKFGYKILSWYVSHKLPVIPINPKEQEILGQAVVNNITAVLQAVGSKQDISTHKTSTVDGVSISFLTPPKITSATLLEIATVPDYKSIVKGLWFQPGSYDQEVLDVAQQIGLSDLVIQEDECILVRGEEGMVSANL